MLFYQALRALGIDVDIRHPDHDLSGYRLVVAPALQLVGERRAAQLAAVAQRARLVVGPRTGYRTPSGRVHEDGQPGPLVATLGCKLLNFDGLPPGLTVEVGGHIAETWAESYRLQGGTATHHYTSGPLTGQPAVVVNGHATTIGAWSATLVSAVLAALLNEVNVPVTQLPDGVRVTRRAGRALWQNFTEQPVQLPDGARLEAVGWRVDG
jgi:beta-galactosidase